MPIKRILVVDDSPTDRHVASEILIKEGYDVTTASSGEEGITRSQELKPDLILMDVIMPGMNGFQATRTITNNTETKHIPVIICTTKGQDTDKIWGMRQGARDYIVKPVTSGELLGKIKALG